MRAGVLCMLLFSTKDADVCSVCRLDGLRFTNTVGRKACQSYHRTVARCDVSR